MLKNVLYQQGYLEHTMNLCRCIGRKKVPGCININNGYQADCCHCLQKETLRLRGPRYTYSVPINYLGNKLYVYPKDLDIPIMKDVFFCHSCKNSDVNKKDYILSVTEAYERKRIDDYCSEKND